MLRLYRGEGSAVFVERMRVTSEFALEADGSYRVGEDGISMMRCPNKANVAIAIDFYDVEPEREHVFNVMLFDEEDRLDGGWTDQVVSVPVGEPGATAVIVQEGLELLRPGRYRFVVIEGRLKQGYGEYRPLYTKDVLVTDLEHGRQPGHSH